MPDFPLLQEAALRWFRFFSSQWLLSTVLFLPIAALTLWRGRRWAFLLHGLWLIVLVRLVVPPTFTAPWSVANVPNLLPFEIEPNLRHSSHASVGHADVTGALPWGDLPMLLALLWLAGALSFSAIYVRRSLAVGRLLGEAQSLSDPYWIARVNFWRNQFGIRRPIELLSSPKHHAGPDASPFTAGVLRPKIYLSEALFEALEPEAIDAVIAHEAAHIRRWDYFWIRLQGWLQVIYFFHPVVWIATGQLNRIRETLCDQWVLEEGTISRRAYGKSLLAVLALQAEPESGLLLPMPAFGCARRRRMMRMEEILHSRLPGRPKRILALGVVLIAAALCLPMASQSTVEISPEETISVRLGTHDPCRGVEQSMEPAWQLARPPWEFPQRSDMRGTPTCPCQPILPDA